MPVSKLAEGGGKIEIPAYIRKEKKQELVGVDLFVNWTGTNPDEIGKALTAMTGLGLKLKMITNRGVKVFPNGMAETYCTDHWRCRYIATSAEIIEGNPVYKMISYESILELMTALLKDGFEVIKTENLYEFDGKRGFSLGQGE